MPPQPYTGVTGFKSQGDILAVLDTVPEESGRLFMAGVLVSNRTLRGETNRWPNSYPTPWELKNIFPDSDRLLSLVHFNTDKPENLLDDMCRAQDIAGPNCDGFQLNMAWPDKKALEQYKNNAHFRGKTVVLQVGNKAIQRVGFNTGQLASRVKEYDGLVDYVFVDQSEGLGKVLDTPFVFGCFLRLERAVPNMGLAAGGGLYDANLEETLEPLRRFDFSIDAQGRLCDTEGRLDVLRAARYWEKAEMFFRKTKQAA